MSSRPALGVLIAGLVLAVGCAKAPAWGDARIEGDAARGKKLVETYECQRCHEGTGATPIAADKHCVHCHQDIERGTYAAPPATLAKWNASIVHLREVPSLAHVGERFRRAWVASFLQRPHDLRPALSETMPRFEMPEADARDIATFLVPKEKRWENFLDADADEGRRVLAARGCGTCHQMDGASAIPAGSLPQGVSGTRLARGVQLAPDLRWARERLQPGSLVDWLRAPETIDPDTAMPNLRLSDREARAAAKYIMTTALQPPKPRAIPAKLPMLERPVSYQEVSARVFKGSCWHCHAEPGYALGDGGPGNTGGLGFPPRAINLAEYSGVNAGYRDDEGKRHSLFSPTKDGTPLLVASLYARQEEEAGRVVSGVRGMPLGLPSLSPEDIQLVATWVAQGRPRGELVR